jgi:predicted alpha/beta-fold hydrolase
MTYRAPRWLPNRHLMTILGNLARWPARLPIRRERWELPDGDFVDVDRLDARRPDAPLVIVCHGLEGSSQAGYVTGVLAEARRHGLGGLALNFRGCSGEPNRLLRAYHSGDTADLLHVVERVIAERPGRPLGLCGFSLGGNVVCKLLGERGAELPPELRAAVAVSVPFDLAGCQRALDEPGLFSWIYRERFLRRLRQKALGKHALLGARAARPIDPARVRSARRLRDFDDAVTAPIHGFTDAYDYYHRSSSNAFLAGVRRPLLVLQAADDPFVPEETLPLERLRENPHVQLELSRAGGHVAFVAGPPWAPVRWAERRAANFLAERLGAT